MPVIADISVVDVLVAFAAALAGAAAFEPVKAARGALRAKHPPLRRWYWQVTYRTGDSRWLQLWSIELVKVRRHGNRISGTMYRVYPARFKRRWRFFGELHENRHLSLIYTSIGEDYGSNGTINLGVLTRWLWSGAFQQIPDAERGATLHQRKAERRETRRIGPSFTEESLIEWVAADSDPNDAIRGFLASIPEDSPASPRHAAKHLPGPARRVLTEAPPFRSWFHRGIQAAAGIDSPLPLLIGDLGQRMTKPDPRPWASPARKALGGDKRDLAA
jgi:hypothetical protein